MDEPPSKQVRQGLCPCPACNMKEYDVRTIQHHIGLVTPADFNVLVSND